MSVYTTVTIELADKNAEAGVREFVDNHEQFVEPKMPDERHLVVHSATDDTEQLAVTLERLLRPHGGAARFAIARSDDSVMQARATVYGRDDDELVELGTYDEDDADYGTAGSILYREVERDLGFDVYTWWDYSVPNMARRYERHRYEEMTEHDWTDESYEEYLGDLLDGWDGPST